MQELVPVGLVRLRDWQARFRALGLRPVLAWRAAWSPSMRLALIASRIEHLPRALRSRLSLVVDVGANTGQWVLALRKFVAIERIEAFEPNPEVFGTLRRRLGGELRAHLHNVALGAQREVRTLYITGTPELASMLEPADLLAVRYSARAASVIKEVTVAVSTLDAVIPADLTVDLLKLDVQGFERRVLDGGRTTLERTRAVLVEMNFVPHYREADTAGALYEQLTRDLGFEFWDMSLPHRGPDGRALWADVVFVNAAMIS